MHSVVEGSIFNGEAMLMEVVFRKKERKSISSRLIHMKWRERYRKINQGLRTLGGELRFHYDENE